MNNSEFYMNLTRFGYSGGGSKKKINNMQAPGEHAETEIRPENCEL